MFNVHNLKLPTGQQISLKLAAGEIHCISGDSGVGKSRLLRALADLDACEGDISLRGDSYREIDACHWRNQVMLVPARPRWWLATAAEHMAKPMDEAAQQIRLNTAPMTGPTERLSTGESTRLALLRALSREPAILLLDEPTAALDEATEATVETLLKDYLKAGPQRAILWITHSKAQAKRVANARWLLNSHALEPQS